MEVHVDESVCKICLQKMSKYKCPKCFLSYCSLDCYKSETHAQCSEGFYKQCFMDGLKERGVDNCEQKKFNEMLTRLQQQFNMDEDEHNETLNEDEVCHVLSHLDEKSRLLWEKLESQEKKTFLELQSKGELASFITLWEPWWIQSSSALIEDSVEINKMLERIPTIRKCQSFHALMPSKKPSEKICYSILNVLYGYAYISRLYNGDISDLLFEATQGLFCISSAFGDSVFSDAALSLNHCIMSLTLGQTAEEYFVSKQFSIAVIQDVLSIVRGPNRFNVTLFMEAALSHCIDIVHKVAKSLHREEHREKCKHFKTVSNADLKKLFLKAVKKLEFFISWIKEHGGCMVFLEPVIEQEFHSQLLSLSEIEKDENVVKEALNKDRYSLVSDHKKINDA